jgi:hypothetical protein
MRGRTGWAMARASPLPWQTKGEIGGDKRTAGRARTEQTGVRRPPSRRSCVGLEDAHFCSSQDLVGEVTDPACELIRIARTKSAEMTVASGSIVEEIDVVGHVGGSRMVGPLRVSRWAWWITRSQIASATLGSPIAACHAVVGSWLAISVEPRSLRSSRSSSRSRRSASVSGASSQSSI